MQWLLVRHPQRRGGHPPSQRGSVRRGSKKKDKTETGVKEKPCSCRDPTATSSNSRSTIRASHLAQPHDQLLFSLPHRRSQPTHTQTHLVLRQQRVLGLGQDTLQVFDCQRLKRHNARKAANKLRDEPKLEKVRGGGAIRRYNHARRGQEVDSACPLLLIAAVINAVGVPCSSPRASHRADTCHPWECLSSAPWHRIPSSVKTVKTAVSAKWCCANGRARRLALRSSDALA